MRVLSTLPIMVRDNFVSFSVRVLSNLGFQTAPISNNSVLDQVVHGQKYLSSSVLSPATLSCRYLYDQSKEIRFLNNLVLK